MMTRLPGALLGAAIALLPWTGEAQGRTWIFVSSLRFMRVRSNCRRLAALFAGLGLVWARPGPAATLDVPMEFPTIAAAFQFAQPGDSVAIHPGYYQQTDPLVLDKDRVTVFATERRQAYIWALWLPDHLLRLEGSASVISGLTFQYLNMSTILDIGYARDSTVVYDNYFDGFGGSDAIWDAGRYSQIIDNDFGFTIIPYSNGFGGDVGGGLIESNSIFNAAGGLDIHNVCTIRRNSIVATQAGFDYGGSLRGGGIFAQGVDGPLVIEDNEIEECRTIGSEAQEFSQGGGIYIAQCSDVRIERNRIVRNQALVGGGISAEACSMRIAGNLVWANGDSLGGNEDFPGSAGGIYARDCAGTVENNTVFCNTARIGGGGMYLDSCPDLIVGRNIVARNLSEGTGGVLLTGPELTGFTCNDVWMNAEGDYGGDWLSDPTGVDGNISLDPEFCRPDSGNFELYSSSPCAGLDGNECGLIGAYGVGCSVQDVPDEPTATRTPFRLFPNPTTGMVWIELSRASQGAALSIVDSQGRRVRKLCQPCIGERFSWDGTLGNGSSAPAGIYYIVGRDRGRKLVVIR